MVHIPARLKVFIYRCKSGLRYTTSFEVVNLVLGLKCACKYIYWGKTNSFWKNCNNIPGESCLQKKSLSVTIVRSKICLGFFCNKHVISSVEMAVFEINDNKPVINYIPWFPISINSLRTYSSIFVFIGPQSGHLQHQQP